MNILVKPTRVKTVVFGGPNRAVFASLKDRLTDQNIEVKRIARAVDLVETKVEDTDATVLMIPFTASEKRAAERWSTRSNTSLFEVSPSVDAIVSALRGAHLMTPEFYAWVNGAGCVMTRPASKVEHRPVSLDDGRVYFSLAECARAFGVWASTIARAIETGQSVRGHIVRDATCDEVSRAFAVRWIAPPDRARTERELVAAALDVLKSDRSAIERCEEARELLERVVNKEHADWSDLVHQQRF